MASSPKLQTPEPFFRPFPNRSYFWDTDQNKMSLEETISRLLTLVALGTLALWALYVVLTAS